MVQAEHLSGTAEPASLPGVAKSHIDLIIQKISGLVVPGREYFKSYMLHKWRMNRKPSTLKISFIGVSSFLIFYGMQRKRLEDVVIDDIEAFLEHEQDRGLKVTTVRLRLIHVIAFLRFLVDRDIMDGRILKRKIKLKVPDFLPRAIAPGDVRKLLKVVKEIRDRALVLILLRTGMRIGEVLRLDMRDLDVKEKKIHIYEGEKNCRGRVVYLSDDALVALKLWLKKRKCEKQYLFYGQKGMLCYTAARNIFRRYLREAGLENKGYTIHSLRHTFASELLNAGMRLEYLQLLMGHHDIEVTRRYARLTDKNREAEYFRAMKIVEKGGIHGAY